MNSTAPLLRSIRNTLRLLLGAILLLVASQQPDLSRTPFFAAVAAICVVAAGLIFLTVAVTWAIAYYNLLAGITTPKSSPPKRGD